MIIREFRRERSGKKTYALFRIETKAVQTSRDLTKRGGALAGLL